MQRSQPGSVAIDLCFVLDVTGSMRPWLQQCKDEIGSIVAGVKARIAQDYPSLDIQLRYGLLAYRDIGDAQQYDPLAFTPDANVLAQKVREGAAGGPSEPRSHNKGVLRSPASLRCCGDAFAGPNAALCHGMMSGTWVHAVMPACAFRTRALILLMPGCRCEA